MLINVGQIVLFNKRFVIVMNSRYINNDHHHSSVFPFYGCAANVIVNTSVNAAYPSIPANLRRSYMGMQVSGNLFHGRVAGFNVPPEPKGIPKRARRTLEYCRELSADKVTVWILCNFWQRVKRESDSRISCLRFALPLRIESSASLLCV